MKITSIQPKSVEVHISHKHCYEMQKPNERERYKQDRDEAQRKPGRANPKAAWTTAAVKVNDQEFNGSSYCSVLDTFNRHKGVQVALGRALKASGLTKAERKLVWEKVFAGKYSPEAK